MKPILKSIVVGSTLYLAGHASAATVSLNFTTIAREGLSSTFSTLGDSWRATNVRAGGGPAMDAIFTITSTTGTTKNNVEFVTEAARGNNMRIRIGDSPAVTNATVFITISLVNAGTSTPYTGFMIGDQLTTQFSDLDSDGGADRSDFAGALTSQYTEALTADDVTLGTSLLDLVVSPDYAPGYTVGILQDPWGPKGNVTSTAPEQQSAVTAAFNFDARTSINIVLGQRSNGPSANRHIDIDMTPDFVIVPEPSAALLGGLGLLALLRRRR